MDSVQDIKKFGKKAQGRSERIKFIEGKPLTRGQAILAQCYECTGGYVDGARDCQIRTCSLYAFHPYRTTEKSIVECS
jgi:hypothetical protein